MGCGGKSAPVMEPEETQKIAEKQETESGPGKGVQGADENPVVEKTLIIPPCEILFETDSPVIMKKSYEALDAVAREIIDSPNIVHVHVACHSDNRGLDPFDHTLTLNRAKAVEAYLLSKGVEPERISAGGYGPYCPVDEADTAEALKKNRRLEFIILETEKGCTLNPFACKAAIDKGLVPHDARKYLPGSDFCPWP